MKEKNNKQWSLQDLEFQDKHNKVCGSVLLFTAWKNFCNSRILL